MKSKSLLSSLNLEDLINKDTDPASSNCCGGPQCCEGRQYDQTKTDCQACLNETYGQ
jgi:hypothetical protein